MESIQELALSTYEKNMEYFSKEQKDLFKTLTVFNLALENGDYPAQYDLEYLDGYFDVKQLHTSHYLYTKNSEEFSNDLAGLIDFKKRNFSFEGFPVYNFSEEKLNDLDDMSSGLDGVYPIMNYYYDMNKPEDRMKEIEKFIFIGTGLGFHIPIIDNKISSDEYFIIEDDIELFRLSLFTTEYFKLAENKYLFFSVADDENLFLTTMKKFLHDTFFYNRYIKYSYFTAHSNDKIKQIQNALMSQSFASFPYKAELRKFIRPLDYINNGYSILNLSAHFEDSIFAKKPVLLITAGPSFEKNLAWLKKNHDKFLLIAVSAVLKTLHANGIVPDIITHIDGFEDSLSHYDDIPVEEYLKDTIAILGPFVLQKVRDMFPKEHVFLYEENTEYFESFGFIISPCVGSFSILLSIIFSTSELYLLGVDLALDQETGSSHADEGHVFYEQSDMDKKDELKNTMSLLRNVFPVKGNFSDTVYTTSILHLSVQSLYNSIERVKHTNQNIYNLNNGSWISNTIPTHIDDIDMENFETINKKELFDSIHDVLTRHSTKSLSDNDIISMKQRLKNTQTIKDDIDEYIQNVSHSNTNKYLYDLLGIVSVIIHKEGRETQNLTHVYFSFFKYILPLIMDLFNTKGLKNEKRHIKKLDKMVQKELLEIEKIYESALEKFIKERC